MRDRALPHTRRCFVRGLAVAGLLAAASAARASAPEPAEVEFLFCHASRTQALIESRWVEFEYLKDEVREKVEGGRITSRTSATRQVHRSRWGVPVNETRVRDGRPLDAGELAAEQAKRDARLRALDLDPEERRRSVQRMVEEQVEQRAILAPAADAFDLRWLGTDWIGGDPVHVVSFFPRPGFRPRSREERNLAKFAGIAFIAADGLYFRRFEVDFIGGVGVRWGGLASLSPGSHFQAEVMEVEPGVPMIVASELWLRIQIMFILRKDERRAKFYREWRRVRPPSPAFVP